MATDMTINAVTVAQPEVNGVKITQETIGSQRRMASGALRSDYIGVRHRISVNWTGLSLDEKTLLKQTLQAALSKGTHFVRLPDGQTWTAQIEYGSYDESQWYDAWGNPFYDIAVSWMEA